MNPILGVVKAWVPQVNKAAAIEIEGQKKRRRKACATNNAMAATTASTAQEFSGF
jgi:hypothetical protein